MWTPPPSTAPNDKDAHMNARLVRSAWVTTLLLVGGSCSSGSRQQPAPTTAPAAAPAAPPVAARPPQPNPTPTISSTVQVPDTVQPGRFDTGKMWTFENAPLDYFQEAYGFRPTADWLKRVRMAALRFSNCSASFVSANGLVMSNHHCAREAASAVTKPGEDLLTNGFYAAKMEDERKAPDIYVDQLVEIRDIT